MRQRTSSHTYTARLIWDGNRGEGRESYQSMVVSTGFS